METWEGATIVNIGSQAHELGRIDYFEKQEKVARNGEKLGFSKGMKWYGSSKLLLLSHDGLCVPTEALRGKSRNPFSEFGSAQMNADLASIPGKQSPHTQSRPRSNGWWRSATRR